MILWIIKIDQLIERESWKIIYGGSNFSKVKQLEQE